MWAKKRREHVRGRTAYARLLPVTSHSSQGIPSILARNVVPGILYLNLGRTSRLYTPKLEPIIPLSRLLLNLSFTYLGTNFALKYEVLSYEGIARNYSVSST